MNLSENSRFRLQYGLGRIFIFIAAPVITLAYRIYGYSVRDLRAVRSTIAARLENHAGPWLICSNHLTMIDSVFIAHAMFSFGSYAVHYRRLPWNIPEKVNLYRIHPLVALICYLLKCIPVVRGGSRDSLNASMAQCSRILAAGESLIIFPEGTRSRNGRIDNRDFPYSVGRFVTMVPDCRVLCLYLRGDHQQSYSDMPPRGERFTVMVEDFKPATRLRGLRAQREAARQVVQRLYEMEKRYFDQRGQ